MYKNNAHFIRIHVCLCMKTFIKNTFAELDNALQCNIKTVIFIRTLFYINPLTIKISCLVFDNDSKQKKFTKCILFIKL